jgi:hypothetical protein
MSSESSAGRSTHGHDPELDASHRQRFGLALAITLCLIGTLISYAATRDVWIVADRRPDPAVLSTSDLAADPAWDIELPEGPHRQDFETSCLICHSARLPFGQPPFGRDKWAEIVHKMVANYGAPLTSEDETHVVDYMLAARPSAP